MLIRPFGPRRGPGLLGAAARTAVVAGTATAVSGAVRRHQVEEASPPPPAPAPQYAPPQPRGVTDDQLERLERLAKLVDAGVLTPEELQAQKAAILGG
ncbi:MAG: SHOCT domain-containing protein [Saccharothrix sp.]|nr:SHOCT domain-containing protein [Saccharothrix sp.]